MKIIGIRVAPDFGFSLVELSVVIAIIGILASVAVPSLQKWVLRSKRTEAHTMLTSIWNANATLYAQFQTYHTSLACLGFAPVGKLRYRTGVSGRRVVSGDSQLQDCETVVWQETLSYCFTHATECTMLTEGLLVPFGLGIPPVTVLTTNHGEAGSMLVPGKLDYIFLDNSKKIIQVMDATE